MTAKETSWFVFSQGRTLGPLSFAELRQSAQKGELLITDTVARAGDQEWKPLSAHADLASLVQNERRPTDFLPELPSLPALRKRIAPPAPSPLPRPEPELRKSPPSAPPPPSESPRAARPKKEKKTVKKSKPAKAEKASEPAKPAPVVSAPKPERALPAEAAAPLPAPAMKDAIFFPERPPLPAPQPVRVRAEKMPSRAEEKNFWKIAALALFVLLVALAAFSLGQKNRRDLKEFPLSDPPSPTTQPPAVGDPIPPLRAPTRPKRD